MKKNMIFCILTLVICSCEINLDDDIKYYRFSKNDYKFIPTVYQDIDRIITFKNQQSEEVKIEVKGYNKNKKSNGGWNWAGGASTDLYYTDQIIIWLDLMDVNFPEIGDGYCDQIHITIEKRSDGTTETILKIPSYSNYCSRISLPSLSPYIELQSMSIGNVSYDSVKVFETEENFLFYDESTIDKIYYDFNQGIIGFDDTENNIQYRIVNE
ncbi:hypothetical protein [uncultured Winogradskyella sp.]|uniref:hypothetical protein n=1 Tax=uncultured Winogradskyella sp. TaxID=395353 RepID=UPI00261BEAC2|nr:hypothetical protein [uncultured Winogradskyella sp.]